MGAGYPPSWHRRSAGVTRNPSNMMTLRGPKLADAEQRHIRTAAAVAAAVLVVLATPPTAAAQLSDGDLRDGACLWLSDKALAQQRSACLVRVRRVNTICHIRMPVYEHKLYTQPRRARRRLLPCAD